MHFSTIKGTGSHQAGITAKVKIKAAKGWYIKSVKVNGKKVKVKKRIRSKTLKLNDDAVIKVVFRKK